MTKGSSKGHKDLFSLSTSQCRKGTFHIEDSFPSFRKTEKRVKVSFLYQQFLVFVGVQSLSPVQLFATPWTAACQASLYFTISPSLLKLMSIELVIPSNHLILCHPLLLPSIFPHIRVFSNELTFHIRWPKYRSFSFTSVFPMNIQG